MASLSLVQALAVPQTSSLAKSSPVSNAHSDGLHCARGTAGGAVIGSKRSTLSLKQVVRMRVGRVKRTGPVCAVGDVSSDATTYLIAGAVAIAVIGTAFPLIFSRKDTCPDCGGAGFIRGQPSGGALRANAARKDQAQIVCRTCNGLGKLGQTDKL